MSFATAYRRKGMNNHTSLWRRLAELPLVFESYELEPLQAAPAGATDERRYRAELDTTRSTARGA